MNRAKGFTLLEIMLALCVLSILILGFSKIINQAIQLTSIAEQESLLRIKVWNDLDQLRTQRIQVGTEELPADDDGVIIQRVVDEIQLKNGRRYLPHLYSIKVTVIPRNQKNPLTAEVYVYQP